MGLAALSARCHVTATFQKPSAFFRAYEIGGESRSVWLSIQSKPENVMEAKIAPRSPHRRGRQTKQAKDRQARRLGSWSVLPDDVGFSREVRYSAALMRYLNSRIQSCYCAPIIWVFAPKNRETERLTLAMGTSGGCPPHPLPSLGLILCRLVHKGGARCGAGRIRKP